MPRKYDYYYLNGVEQFTFYQLPKELLENPIFAELSLDAKILYAILRDKMSLSRSNKWIDEEGRVYILYSVTNIMKDMSIGKGKALKHLAELEESADQTFTVPVTEEPLNVTFFNVKQKDDSPKTGDTNHAILYISIAGGMLLLIGVLLIIRRRREE